MSASDVLAGIEEIDWSGLKHAYGSADDVPQLLRQLRAGSQEARDQALYELYGNIYHQGSRYPATAPAVPFLLALAADPDTPGRDEIVHLLVAIAIGFDEEYLPHGVNAGAWREGVARLRLTEPAGETRKMDWWVDEARTEGERRVRAFRLNLFDFEASLDAAEAELAAYDAVRTGTGVLRGLLEESDPSIRGAAAYALGWFPEEAAASREALRTLLRSEPNPGVAANAIISAGLLGHRDLVPRERLADPEPLVRWAAAIALARMDVIDAEVTGVLAAASLDPPENADPKAAFFDGDLRGYASETLAALDGRYRYAGLG